MQNVNQIDTASLAKANMKGKKSPVISCKRLQYFLFQSKRLEDINEFSYCPSGCVLFTSVSYTFHVLHSRISVSDHHRVIQKLKVPMAVLYKLAKTQVSLEEIPNWKSSQKGNPGPGYCP